MAAAKMTPLPTGKYVLLLTILIAHSIIGGYWAGTRPSGAGWRFFSWHPLLMMLEYARNFLRRVDTQRKDPSSYIAPHFNSFHSKNLNAGMVGMMGTAALTKKRMGYTNTKLHGIMAWAGMMLSAGGFYVIYANKNQMGKDHFTTLHSWAGLSVLVGCTMAGIAGGVFLHPDFGIDKQNGTIRTAHKYMSRVLLLVAWVATLSGLKTLIGDDMMSLIVFAGPLAVAAPFTLM
ncbi:hypothetical protein HJC23_001677 [Cyclotella cryptica]|uniref:Cytochrome b561 domain-containing protein n=1 Tax=Cyclotella cryptica TaxID=29204 RepID=A0ABD3QKT1_9STRA|eukprot:CCRYP_004710-RA/>CCRYP_004710-RA protein AED:0.11 eAED:0.11 QI:67/0.33/0.5/1/0.33/0.5/4/270/231